MLKWQKAATKAEIRRVAAIDRRIERETKGVAVLKSERRLIIQRCNVRGWRDKQ